MLRNRKLIPLSALAFAVVAIALVAAGVGFWPAAPTEAQGRVATNVNAVESSGEPGTVTVSWNPVAGATFNRVGWVSLPDYRRVVAAKGETNWLDAFAFQDISGSGTSRHVIQNLAPGTKYGFIIGSISKRFGDVPSQPSGWSEWKLLDTNAVQTTVCPSPGVTPPPGFGGGGGGGATATPTPGTCPITGLPVGDGYKSVGQTVSGPIGSYRLDDVAFPNEVVFPTGNSYQPADGRAFVSICGTFRNGLDFSWSFLIGRNTMVNTESGVGFYYGGRDSDATVEVQPGASQPVCQIWTIPSNARTIIVPVSMGLGQSDIHLYRYERP